MIKKKNVYDDFVNGAKDGFTTVIKVMPTLIGLMVAVGVLRESGFMTDLGNVLGKFTDPIGFPGQLMPVTIVKIFSSSAATGMVLDIFKEYGPDSYIGNVVSLMMSSTETVFYTMSVYFMAGKSDENKMDFIRSINFNVNRYSCKCNISRIVVVKENPEIRHNFDFGIFCKIKNLLNIIKKWITRIVNCFQLLQCYPYQ